ncbi:MAG: Mur ligase family protein [Patescibacteria group bacterium]|nr:Mur ligase family protein [Patescibacteria group bacterium]
MKKIFKQLIQYYLKILTKIVIWRHKPVVIAIAGTTNKTFVKEVILDELGRCPDIRGNPKSFNTEIGLPLAVLFLPSGYSSMFRWVDVLLTGTCVSIFSRDFPKVLVLEMGTDRKGDMKYLLSMVKPTIAIITNIDRNFPDTGATLDDIAFELSFLTQSIPENGAVVLNGEDLRVRRLKEKTKAKVVLYGTDKKCGARISDIEILPFGQRFKFDYQNSKQSMEIKRHGRHNINALVIAKIVDKELRRIEDR